MQGLPDGARFAVKLRWRRPDGPWMGLMGASMICGMDGRDARVIARATSHVMWLGPQHLYPWNQRDGVVARLPDRPVTEPLRGERLAPDIFTANVHLRHIHQGPRRVIFDTPYAETVTLPGFDMDPGRSDRIATFPAHHPHHGPFRCDLHPVPSADDGRRIVSRPRIVMTVLARNEADIIGDMPRWQLAHGVDHVVAMDNASDDGTTEILEELPGPAR